MSIQITQFIANYLTPLRPPMGHLYMQFRPSGAVAEMSQITPNKKKRTIGQKRVVLSCSADIKGFPLLRDADSEGGHPCQPRIGNAYGRSVITPALARHDDTPITSAKISAFPFWSASVRHSTICQLHLSASRCGVGAGLAETIARWWLPRSCRMGLVPMPDETPRNRRLSHGPIFIICP